MAEMTPGHEDLGRRVPRVSDEWLREQLLERRTRLADSRRVDREGVLDLIRDVDAALGRMDDATFGLCGKCHDPIEAERLFADPLTRVCLGCLSPEQTRALERDLEMASFIQAGLLPAPEIRVAGWEFVYHYRPLGPVSGDHCDVLVPQRADEPLHFVLGDVSGKGVAASLLMAHLHAIFRSLAPLQLPLGTLVRQANRLFAESTLPSSFATLAVGRLWSTGVLELANAGHATPLLLRAGEIEHVPATGLPVGFFADSEYSVVRFELQPEDLLLLYTDGLFEACDSDGSQYGIERVSAALAQGQGHAPGSVIEHCLADLAAFQGDGPTEDDLTVMAIRRTG